MPYAGPSRRVVAWAGLVILVLYSLWIGGPYLRSIVVRNAAVTAWLHVAATPIDGLVTSARHVGDRVGADGRILTVENPRADPIAFAQANADLARARERAATLARIVRDLESLTAARSKRAAEYSALFKRNLDIKIGGMTDYVAVTRRRIELERTEAARRARLTSEGRESQSTADAAAARVADLERAQVDVQTALDRATQHRRAADAGVYFLDDGSDGAVEQRGLEDARVTLDRARGDLAAAQRDVESAQRVAGDAQRLFERSRSADVAAPPGAIIWNDSPAAGAAVHAGAPVAAWIDCRALLVDAPVSDVGISLLHAGSPARVVLEGERRTRNGTVLLVRGATATIGSSDLAAIAKGRHTGVGQALITLDTIPADAEACPVGRAAFVHFPDVTMLDILRARLRW